jgi:hypothetical protein
LADALLISKMTTASLWTFRISGIKNMLFYVCFSLIVRDMLCMAQSEILFCDVQLYIFCLNWWIGTRQFYCVYFLFCGMELFELVFAIALYLFCNCFFSIAVTCCFCNCFLQSHCDKVAITHMRQGCNHAHASFATVFCNCSTSVVATTL